ncbi:galactose-3-O-sulfotransferase 2-like isoform X1 [Carcharodon carcharias]|uniref:galactose-3-O-sulfotransferase 2-like isoform X1 n=1 Tax=Carcharodon carcharias TaxID=13397 RepID=UPI001B7F088C|nr:galactose-3-O-sulfotransferase 2-like isoform X1 [Carcharodon carcharias]
MRKPRLLHWCTLNVLWMTVVILMAIGLAIQTLGITDKKRVTSDQLDQPRVLSMTPHNEGVPWKPCQSKTHVMFLKTHKTASSTILNILYRFGEARNLTFALPNSYQFGYPYLFSTRKIKYYSSIKMQEYHIICNHMRFFRPQVEKVMSKGTFYFSILRNPVTLAESAFTYYKGSSTAFKKVESLEQFLSEPWKYYAARDRGNQYARNLMWFDFGFDHNANDTKDYVDLVLKEIGGTFHLILLSEYFDESMVLLKDALCWEFDDVVSFKLNFRSNVTVRKLSDETVGRVKAWNSLDWKLYLHFNRTFWQRVEVYGWQRMRNDVLVLQEKRKRLMDLCLQGSRPVEASQIQDKNIKPFQYGRAQIMGYNLNPNLDNSSREKCLRMVMPELQYKDLLDAKLFPFVSTAKSLQTPQLHF